VDDVSILDRGELGRQSADGGDVEFVLVRLCEALSAFSPRKSYHVRCRDQEDRGEGMFMREEGLSVAGLRG
jgi:hypothetical protein